MIFSSVPVWLWDAPTALRLFMLWLIAAVLAAGQDHSCRSACRGAKLVSALRIASTRSSSAGAAPVLISRLGWLERQLSQAAGSFASCLQ